MPGLRVRDGRLSFGDAPPHSF